MKIKHIDENFESAYIDLFISNGFRINKEDVVFSYNRKNVLPTEVCTNIPYIIYETIRTFGVEVDYFGISRGVREMSQGLDDYYFDFENICIEYLRNKYWNVLELSPFKGLVEYNEIVFTVPKNPKFGDYSTNLPIVITNKLKVLNKC